MTDATIQAVLAALIAGLGSLAAAGPDFTTAEILTAIVAALVALTAVRSVPAVRARIAARRQGPS